MSRRGFFWKRALPVGLTLRWTLCLLHLSSFVHAQEVYVPDITTIIAGEELEVVEEALPDYAVVIPQQPPVSQAVPPPSQEEPVAGSLPPSLVELAARRPTKAVCVEGLVAPAWPFGLVSRLNVHTTGVAPLLIDFSYETVGGYGLHTAEEGFFHNRSLFSLAKTFLPGQARLETAVDYKSLDTGLQGQSLLFDDINRREASARVDVELPLAYGFSLGARVPVNWYSRYAGFSSTVGRPEVNRGVALSILQVSPRLEMGWNSEVVPSIGSDHDLSLELNLGWNLSSSLDPEVALSRNRVGLELRGFWLWNASLKIDGNLALLYFPSGTGADQVRLVVPFALGLDWNSSLQAGSLRLFARGGLESRQVDCLDWEDRETFVNFTATDVLTQAEQSDWFLRLGAELPLVEFICLDLAWGFQKSALGNWVLTGDYAAGPNSWTGLFPGHLVDRTEITAGVGVTLELADFFVRTGWQGSWLYVPAWLPPHTIFLSVGYDAPVSPGGEFSRWGGRMMADFGIQGPDNVPILAAMAYFKPMESVRLALELEDMVKLFSGRQRIWVGPYVKDSGSVSISLQFRF